MAAIASFLYLFGGWCFPIGSILAMQCAKNKAHAASAQSFLNMGSATLAVFIVIAGFAVIISVALTISYLNNRKNSAAFNA